MQECLQPKNSTEKQVHINNLIDRSEINYDKTNRRCCPKNSQSDKC